VHGGSAGHSDETDECCGLWPTGLNGRLTAESAGKLCSLCSVDEDDDDETSGRDVLRNNEDQDSSLPGRE